MSEEPLHRWCDWRRDCPEGREASEAADPWAGLPDEVG